MCRTIDTLRLCALLALSCVGACGDDDDGKRAAADAAPGRDAAPGSADRDAAVPGGGGPDAAPPTGCSRDSDCAIPESAGLCVECNAGEADTCLEPKCRDHACVLELTAVCPSIARVFRECTSDADCSPDELTCLHECVDGESACLQGQCRQGRCLPRFLSCGMEHCPPGTAPVRAACGGCGLSGGCSSFVTGCLPSCSDHDECSGEPPFCDMDAGACVPAWGCV